MNSLANLLLALIFAILLSGCATPPNKMGLAKAASSIDTSHQSLVLMTVHLNHAAKPSVTPTARIVYVEMPGVQSKEKNLIFEIDDEAGSIGPDGADYLIRMALPAGKYTLVDIHGGGGIAIFPGYFSLPLVAEFDVKQNSVTYLGRIEARTRARQGDEFRAGSLVPLIDQAITGWSTSTWDVVIRDAYESDTARLRESFPALKGVKIDKDVLTFDRAKVQVWWDKK